MASQYESEELLELARERFSETWCDGDEKLFGAIGEGEIASFSATSDEENDPASAAQWDNSRVVYADRIRWLCFSRRALSLIPSKGIRIDGARIDGDLNLEFAKVSLPIILRRCAVTGSIILEDAEFSQVNFEMSRVGAVSADGLTVTGSVYLRDGFVAEGEISLLAATVEGNLDCVGGTFANGFGCAIRGDGVIVTGSVQLRHGFVAEGEVRLLGANVGGNLECDGGKFANDAGNAIHADGLKVTGDVYLRNGFVAEGAVVFSGAEIGGHLQWRDVVAPERATLELDSAKIDTLWDEEESWPNRLSLHGLEYNQIFPDAPRDAKRRLKWFGKQEQFSPQPYQRLAKVLRSVGEEHQARLVLIGKEKHRRTRGSLSQRQRWWSRLKWLTWDHGYRPHMAFLRWAWLFLIGGTLLFSQGHKAGVIWPDAGPNDNLSAHQVAESYPKFNPIIYSIDSFVPIINLHQEDYWLPSGLLRWYHWLHISFGWLLSFLFVAGLSGLVRKD